MGSSLTCFQCDGSRSNSQASDKTLTVEGEEQPLGGDIILAVNGIAFHCLRLNC